MQNSLCHCFLTAKYTKVHRSLVDGQSEKVTPPFCLLHLLASLCWKQRTLEIGLVWRHVWAPPCFCPHWKQAWGPAKPSVLICFVLFFAGNCKLRAINVLLSGNPLPSNCLCKASQEGVMWREDCSYSDSILTHAKNAMTMNSRAVFWKMFRRDCLATWKITPPFKTDMGKQTRPVKLF